MIKIKTILALSLMLLTFVIYFQVKDYDFLNYDDIFYVSENEQVKSGLNIESLKWSFKSTLAGNWHPLTWISHLIVVELFGLDGGFHHLANLCFHILNTGLLFFILTRMTGDIWRSFIVAALFGIHPLHVESVAWISERKDVLSTFFGFISLWCYVRYVEKPNLNRYLLIILFFIFSLMSKSMLVTLPFILILLDYWPLKRGRLFIGEKIPFFILSVIFSIISVFAQKSSNALGSLQQYPLYGRIANALISYVSYLEKTIWPFFLNPSYPYPNQIPMSEIFLSGFLLIFISLISLKYIKNKPWIAFGWLWYLGTLVPVIGLVQIGMQGMADRYTYIPIIGIFIMICWSINYIKYKFAITTITSAIICILMITTWYQKQFWSNNTTYYQYILDINPNDVKAHNNLGVALKNTGLYEKAIWHFYEAIKLNSKHSKAYNNLGLTLFKKGKIDEAIYYYNKSLKLDPNNVNTLSNLGNALRKQKKTEEAIKHYNEALRLNPNSFLVNNNLGNALLEQGKLKEAIYHFNEALKISPSDPSAHNNLANAFFYSGKIAEAIQHYNEALKINPNYIEAKNNLEYVLKQKTGINDAK
ncbi:MAG: tetratricopeptide repeat protein [Desulfobacterales bacterium]|nr:tetratricopeptide repeat protein [Desulfobacterales bacterium]MBF0397393.1 tetratricopeptide repeat protein [Desulfobacterales bacterium]